MDLEGKWKAIIIGGVITGFAPFVPIVNIACCLIPFAAAIVAVAIYSNSPPPHPLSDNDGIALGVMTGIIGTLIYAVLIIPLVFILGHFIGGFLGQVVPDFADLPERVRPLVQSLLGNFGNILVFLVIFKILSHLALSLLFGILGGIAGIAIFRRTSAA